MSSYREIIVLVEGQTEKIFVQKILAPFLASKQIVSKPIIIDKPGEKGGDVRFSRVKKDIGMHIKQRQDTHLTLFVDYYGLKNDWPGYTESKELSTPESKADLVNRATSEEVRHLFVGNDANRRFIPYVAMHEFEAMLFSDPKILADKLQVPQAKVDQILKKCLTPETIDDSPNTAPSKRLASLSARFKKTKTGIVIAEQIGLCKIRERCPVFNRWLEAIERIKPIVHTY